MSTPLVRVNKDVNIGTETRMDKEVSIVHSPESSNYRNLARVHWGLSKEQMVGMHVHHHPPKSQGG